MAVNLHRVLTSYVASPITVDHPAAPKSGDPCRVGKMVGIALVNEQFGYSSGGYRELVGFHVNKPVDPINIGDYADGETPVTLQQNEWMMSVKNVDGANNAPKYTPVYYYDADVAGVDVSADGHIIIGVEIAANALVGMIMEAIPANTTKKVPVMLTPTASPELTPVALA